MRGSRCELALDHRADLEHFCIPFLVCQVHFAKRNIVRLVLRAQELQPRVNRRCVLAFANIVNLVLERFQRPVARCTRPQP